jgi:predicted Zn-ribbon and HTH transcriptional regulator
MGSSNKAKCKSCGHKFEASEGGGFMFDLLRCDTCGASKSVGHDEVAEHFRRFVKGSGVRYSVATSERDRQILQDPEISPMSEDEFHAKVEEHAGTCSCGGHFKYDAPIRCPKCRSTKIKEGKTTEFYD